VITDSYKVLLGIDVPNMQIIIDYLEFSLFYCYL